ncbi:hypothetical protein [Proteus mirabilis]|uniref:hypothetical protein n=1 Tax=Proteus mirabilis TaxID=584 RepID=UPI0034D71D41
MSQENNSLATKTLNKFVLPKIKDTLASSGKKETQTNLCRAEIENLQELQRLANKAYDHFNSQVAKQKKEINDARVSANVQGNVISTGLAVDFVLSRIRAGENTARRMMIEINKVLDPYKPTYTKMSYSAILSFDFAVISEVFQQFEENLFKIEAEGRKIKEEAKESIQEVTSTTESQFISQANIPNNEKPLVPMLAFKQIMFEMDMYMILPDNTRINIEGYISEFLVSMDFDSVAMPIYSASMKFPSEIYNQIRNHFENIKWFFTIRKIKKTMDSTEDPFSVPDLIKDNEELIAIDPKFTPSKEDKGKPEGSLPIYPLKIDFISALDFRLNSKVKAKTLNRVKMIDVLGFLCSELRKEFQKKGIDTKDDVKFTISPPDNKTVYDQVIISPGSFASVIYQLQTVYGIYQTGVNVSFDGVHPVKDPNTGKIISEKYVTISEKGGTAPSQGGISDVILEIVDPNNNRNAAYTSGFVMDNDNNSMIIRTNDPYTVIKNNSSKLSKGETIRVMSASDESNSTSICDTPTDISDPTQKFYWSKYDNPYALTQLQDSVREKNLSIIASVRDVDVFMLNNNMNYFLKFFSLDDDTATGRYRLSKLAFYFTYGKSGNKTRIEVEGTLHFTNLPELRVNGKVTRRPTYAEKVGNTVKQQGSDASKSPTGAKPGQGGGFNPNSKSTASNSGDPYGNAPSSPFPCNFVGRKDFYSVKVPEKLDSSYEMSGKFKLQDVCTTDGSFDPFIGKALAEDFNIFINAQRFCNDILEKADSIKPIGKIENFFKIQTDASEIGSSFHVIALACDIKPASGDGLVDVFLKYAQGIPNFNNLVLQSDGSKWTGIHIDYVLNEVNNKNIIIVSSPVKGDSKKIMDISKFVAEPNKLFYSEHKKYV